jgi:hypothetical protein
MTIMADPLRFDPERVWLNARRATTEDLLDRVTAYRAGMEPAALVIIEAELRSRGIGEREIEEYAESQPDLIVLADGVAASCSFCRRPAVASGWGWHRFWHIVPLFPRYFYYCPDHRPRHRGGSGQLYC